MGQINRTALDTSLKTGMALSTICALFKCEEDEVERFVQEEYGMNLDTYRSNLLARNEFDARVAAANFVNGHPTKGDEQVHRHNAKKFFQQPPPAPEPLISIGGHELMVSHVRSVETREQYCSRRTQMLYYLVVNRSENNTLPLANTTIPFPTAAARTQAQETLHQARARAQATRRR